MNISFRLLIASSAFASFCFAVETRTWSQNGYSDFEKGNLKKLSLSSDGRLALAPVFREIFDSSSVYLWALAQDSRGNLYAAGGGPGGPGARLYMIPPNGKGKTLAQLDDLEIHALAIDKQDQVYAATSPDGKVYKILPGGKTQLFYDPHAKYIWGMAFDSRQNLYVATGDKGELHRVTPQGKGDVFYSTGETHARSLAIDAKDNVLVGTEPGGLIIRVDPAGQGFVLYQAAKREITALAVSKDGSVLASGVGNKRGASAALSTPAPILPAPQASPTPAQPPSGPAAAVRTVPMAPAPMPGAPASVSGGSEVYRISPDGFPRRIWSHAQNIAYSIGFDSEGRALVGTGNKGTIYRIDSDRVYTDLLSAPPTQVTCLFSGRDGKLYAATGNVGKVYQIGPELEKEGTIESDVFDAGSFSYWGRLSFQGRNEGGRISLEARSGNLDRPQKDWSPWSASITTEEGGPITAPPARFLQWRAVLRVSAKGTSPEVRSVNAAYLPKNVAPVIDQIEITPANYRFSPQTLTATPSQTLTLPPLGKQSKTSTPALGLSSSGSNSMQYAKGFIGARWSSGDENDDSLVYTVSIRGEKETEWKLLKDKVNDRHIAWDSAAFPDGEYRVRVTASDSPGNPPGQALTAEIVSDPFLIDNTPPRITGLAATPSGSKLTVKWRAADALSIIGKAEYSLNGGEWTVVEPVTKLSDSKEEDYELAIERPSAGEQTIAVRISDEYDNQAVDKIVVR